MSRWRGLYLNSSLVSINLQYNLQVEKMKEKFDRLREKEEEISLVGRMYTSSPNLKELRDITPYLTANWIAHKFPRSEDNTRSLSTPETSLASRDTSIVRRDKKSPVLRRSKGRFESSRYTKGGTTTCLYLALMGCWWLMEKRHLTFHFVVDV